MKARLIVTWFAAASLSSPLLFAAFNNNYNNNYPADYAQNPVIADAARWQTNGSVTFQSNGVTFPGKGGSLISIPAISGDPNSYEVTTTLALKSGGGTYIQFLRTGGSTVQLGSTGANYYSVEVVVPASYQGSGSATGTLNMNQCVNGSVTTMASTNITVSDGMILRTLMYQEGIWVFNNGVFIYGLNFSAGLSGNPGIGGSGIPAGSGISSVKLTPRDTVAPQPLNAQSVVSSILPNQVSVRVQGTVDNPGGIGVFIYDLVRDGAWLDSSTTPALSDSTVQPSTTYNYSIFVIDYHYNLAAPISFTITTPPAGAIDPKRTGVRPTGSYWGGGGEQIDTLSGNLNFSIPLIGAKQRSGSAVNVGLSYNSQNWRQDSGVNWPLGNDVGYGFGWRFQIGSITPYRTVWWDTIDHYVFTDPTGAEYRLGVNNNGIWSSTESAYVWFDQNADTLHFKDGSFWVMGSTSGGTEQDSATMYPTIIEDAFGNQVIVTYDTGAGLPYQAPGGNGNVGVVTPNTSSRIISIEDARAVVCGPQNTGLVACRSGLEYVTYAFSYDHTTYAIPHLTGFINLIGTPEFAAFSFTTGAQGPPFGADASYNGATAVFLTQAAVGPAGPYQFTYDAAGAGELGSAIFPYGGKLSWNYGSFAYVGSRSLREVSGRYVAGDSAHATTPWSYGISRPDAANSVAVHSAMTLTDASGVGAKTWNFTSSGAAWQLGLVSEFVQSASAGGTVLEDDTYTWAQNSSGNPYISAKSTTTGQGTGNQQTATSTQTLDQYGNVTQSVIYPYNNTSTPLRTFNNTYLTDAKYTQYYIYNLLGTSMLTTGGTTRTLVSNGYGTNSSGYPNCVTAPGGSLVCGGYTGNGQAPTREYDTSSPVPLASRPILTTSVTNAKGTGITYYTWGTVAGTSASDGATTTASADAATNYAAPQAITTQSYNETVSYTPWLGIAQTTGANGEQMSIGYDVYGRPATGTSPYTVYSCQYSCGPTTTWSYATAAPFWQREVGPKGVTTTTVDGFGRAVRVARGDSNGVQSYVDTVYAPCACSPLGKLQKVSQPYPANSSASAWTTYTYDGLGRTLSVQLPDGASTTTYLYAANQTKVTDPAGKWKQFYNDVLGNLVTVTEPDPAIQPSGSLATTYTYDWMNHVSQVTMARAGTTQTRSFIYDDAGRLTSATNPENGTVTYTYNADNTVQNKHDAKGQDTTYSYDSKKRVTQVQRYYLLGNTRLEDFCARVTYSYDGNGPVTPGFSHFTQGRLTTVQYGVTNGNSRANPIACTYGGQALQFEDVYTEMYSYHPAGAVTAKQLQFTRQFQDDYGVAQTGNGSLEVDYTYDYAGRPSTVTYPMTYTTAYGTQPVLIYGYDSMGRPVSLSDTLGGGTGASQWVSNVQYDYAGRMTAIQYPTNVQNPGSSYALETRNYNVNGQLASLGWTITGLAPGGIQYVYPAAQNNGQITQAIDTVSGETITYQYDALKRLTSATSAPNNGSYPSAWTQTYQYDGFGNLTGKVLNGSASPIAVDAGTNRLVNASYDLNGNMLSGTGPYSLTYDEANRISSATAVSGGVEYYGYAADNKRIYRQPSNGGLEILTFYGAKGEKLGNFPIPGAATSVCNPSCRYQYNFVAIGTNVWFGGRMIWDSGNAVVPDRLGTNRSGGARFYPYGEEITSTGNDREKFGTYTRDAYTGLDYADQRYYASSFGRFNTVDPAPAKAAGKNPIAWNRYSYTNGDPVNANDPKGLLTLLINGSFNDSPEWANPNSDFAAAVSATFGEQVTQWSWDGNFVTAASGYFGIYAAGDALAKYINEYQFGDGEQLNIVAHSHGGNVVKIASLSLSHAINNLVTLGTPENYDLPNISRSAVKNYCAVSSFTDPLQFFGGGVQQIYNVGYDLVAAGVWEEQAVEDLLYGSWLDFEYDEAIVADYFADASLWYTSTKVDPLASHNVLLTGYSHSDLHTAPVWNGITGSCGLGH